MNSTVNQGIVFDPILPEAVIGLLGLLLLALTGFTYWRVGAVIPRWRNLLLLLFRITGIALVLTLLLQPSREESLPPPNKERVTVVAVDTSGSMKQADVEHAPRLEAAKTLLEATPVVADNGRPENPKLPLYEFSDDAHLVQKPISELQPNGPSTRLHKSIQTLLAGSGAGEAINAIVLLSDGHDHELVNPAKTGAAARARQIPIYAVALGKQGKVRDVSARITSYQPYCYVKQKAQVTASLRLIGCEFEALNVQLLRAGQVVQNKRLNADELQELPVEFEVLEPETGQYEYEVRALPLEAEADNANNSAITYLNVIDQQIRVLLLEGDPYWDSTFLHRSLMRNDKFEVDALIRYGADKLRVIRKTPGGELRTPATLDQFAVYDAIILGRNVEALLNETQLKLLEEFVKDRSGTVIFSRGHAFENSAAAGELEPVIWGDQKRDRVRVDVAADGRGLAAFRTLGDGGKGMESLPDLLNGHNAAETRPLTATLAQAAGIDDVTPAPAIVHRRYGRGQVVSVGVEGLWRWALNAKVESANAPFDRFWDQLILWLLAGRDFIPNRQFSFRPNSANIVLGEKVHFRMTMRQPDSRVKSLPLKLFLGETEVARVNLTAASDPGRLTAEYLPERVGRYRATANFPDGTTQESRFIVFNENVEETEVATDVACLRRICESSGGRLIEPTDLPRLLEELGREPAEMTPKTWLKPVWNVAWVFYGTALVFALDWFLRRRWGLC
ncbi:MAG: VWA domain-containing protein [Verrucomicrobiota bacterium]